MVVVSNTSPISNLALIERLELLRDQFECVWIPEAVRLELDRLRHPAAQALLKQARTEEWIQERSVQRRTVADLFAAELGRGEAEALTLALERNADLLLMDEREGRAVARQAGLTVRGVLGILLRAKATGKIVSVRAEIANLRQRARFFVAPALEAKILQGAGE